MDYIIESTTVIPVEPEGIWYEDYSIVIEDGFIVDMDKSERIKRSGGHEILNGKHWLILPGFINSHTHLPETIIRGICDDAPLSEWLWHYVWPMERKMSREDAKISAMLGCIELIRNGCTGIIDQFYYTDEIAYAVMEAGLRALLCPSIFDGVPGVGSLENAFVSAKKFVLKWKNIKGRITPGIGPHAPYTVPVEMLENISSFANDLDIPVHIHVSETMGEVRESKKKFGATPVGYLNKIKLLNERTLAAHCVHLSKEDIKIIRHRNMNVLHCPTSNLKIGSGIAPIPALLSNKINVAVGTDGNASNNNLSMLEEMAITGIIQKGIHRDPTLMRAEDILTMATINGARAMGMEKETGSIKIGKRADITAINLNSASMQPLHNPISNIVYSASNRDIEMVMVDGRILMKNGRVLTLKENVVLSKIKKIHERLRNK